MPLLPGSDFAVLFQCALKIESKHSRTILRQSDPVFISSTDLASDSLLRRHFCVMTNVLPDRCVRVYDLKGTTEDRWVDPGSGLLLKDTNFAALTIRSTALPGAKGLRTARNSAEDFEFQVQRYLD